MVRTTVFWIFFLESLFLFFPWGSLQAQEEFSLQYSISGEVERSGEGYFTDSLEGAVFVQDLIHSLYKEGFLMASLTDKKEKPQGMEVEIQTGEAYEWLSIRKGNLEEGIAQMCGFDQNRFSHRPVNFREVHALLEKILEEAENHGYPFASVRLDSLEQHQHQFNTAIHYDPGPHITFDTLRITGNSKTRPLYLARRLHVLPGTSFSQRKIDQSLRALQNIPYFNLAGSPELSFQNQEATFYLPLDDRKMNSLDGIIGFLPNEIEENKMLVTGQFDLELYNVSGKGRDYKINWQRLSQYSQNLRLSAVEPLLLGSQVDLKASFFLLKEDTSFLNRDFRIDLGYRISPTSYLSFFNRRQAGDLLAVSQFKEAVELPAIADFRYNNYGMNLQYSNQDDIFFPRKGWFSEFTMGLGNKKILQNTGLPERLYQNIELNSLQYYMLLDLFYHLQIKPSIGSLFRVRAGKMGNQHLFLNDLFRIGGLKTFRGFNENYFFADQYAYINIEPRYYFDTYSYFMIFADAGIMDNSNIGLGRDFPFSVGGGFSMETSGGIFNFIYAMGHSNTQPMGFNFSKIHFGYTGRF